MYDGKTRMYAAEVEVNQRWTMWMDGMLDKANVFGVVFKVGRALVRERNEVLMVGYFAETG